MDQFLSQSIQYIKGVGAVRAEQLAKQGFKTIRDLLYYFPVRYDFGMINSQIASLEIDTLQQIEGTLHSLQVSQTSSHLIIRGQLQNASGQILCLWFNQPYLQKQLKLGMRLTVRGRLKWNNFSQEKEFHIQDTLWDQPQGPQGPQGILPIYTLGKPLTQIQFRKILNRIFEMPFPDGDYYDPSFRRSESLIPFKDAIHSIHFPKSTQALQSARYRLVFEELFFYQIPFIKRKLQRMASKKALKLTLENPLMTQYLNSVPYELTPGQKSVLDDISVDLSSGYQMNRLIQGDVGVGKTDVAIITMLAAIFMGKKALLLAPTEILAEQHAIKCQSILGPLGLESVLIKGGQSAAQRRDIEASLLSERPLLVIGTHALIQDKLQIKSVAVVIVDEQHRFGVYQRLKLQFKGFNPHTLFMSATPIPRSMILTAFGDLDQSIIAGKPIGRQDIQTFYAKMSTIDRVYRYCLSQVEAGKQVYLVYPLIEENETLDYRSLIEEYERCKTTVFSTISTAILHGKMPGSLKSEMMDRFKRGEINVLFSTTVIEVGVDVPNANIMVIVHAERYGLSQLHQLRGRVGRSDQLGQCFLVSDSKSEYAKQRIKVMLDCKDGFQLAEYDLKLRGPGEIFGTQQSGSLKFKIADLKSDMPIFERASQAVYQILNKDFHLQDKLHYYLKKELMRRSGDLDKVLLN